MARYTDEQVIAAIDAAPEPVRAVIRDIETSRTIGSIGKSYGIHIDIIGKISELNRNLLIGLTSPAEVLGELIMAGVETDKAKNILNDLNERIFIPIQAKLRQGGTVPPLTSMSENSEPAPKQPESPPHFDLGVEAQLPAPVSLVTAPAAALESLPHSTPAEQHAIIATNPASHPGEGWHTAASVHVFVPSRPVMPDTLDLTQRQQTVPANKPVDTPITIRQAPPPPVLPGQEPLTPSAPLVKERENDPYREPIA